VAPTRSMTMASLRFALDHLVNKFEMYWLNGLLKKKSSFSLLKIAKLALESFSYNFYRTCTYDDIGICVLQWHGVIFWRVATNYGRVDGILQVCTKRICLSLCLAIVINIILSETMIYFTIKQVHSFKKVHMILFCVIEVSVFISTVTRTQCKTNTIPILMHHMRISTDQVSSVVLRQKKLKSKNCKNCKRAEKTKYCPWNWAKSVEG
jgi:hypothetical protein